MSSVPAASRARAPRRPPRLRRAALAWSAILGLGACTPRPSDWTAVRARSAGAEVVVEAPDEHLAALARRSTADAAHGGRILALRFDDSEAASWLERLGAEPAEDGGWTLAGLAFGGSDDLVLACFEDPERPGLPLALHVGGDGATLPAWLAETATLTRRPGLRIVLGRETALVAPLDSNGRFAEGGGRLVVAERVAARGGMLRHRPAGELATDPGIAALRVQRPRAVRRSTADEYLARAAAALERARRWCGATEPIAAQLDLVADADDFAALGGRDDPGVCDPTGTYVAALLQGGVPDDAGAAAAEAVARRAWGPPATRERAQAFGFAAADACWGRGLVGPPAGADAGPLEAAAATAARVAALANAGEFERLRAWWDGAALPAAADPPRAEPPARRGASIGPARELRGVVVDPAPVPLADTAATLRDLARAAALGANGVSLSCTVAEAAGLPEWPGERPVTPGRTLQGDALVAALLAAARDAGLEHRTLRPHVLVEPGGVATARVRRTTMEEWTTALAARRRAAAHAAQLAEFSAADLLCVGDELGQASATESEDGTGLPAEVLDAKRAGWRSTFAAARARFGGDVSYLASWPVEAQRFALWDEADVVCVAWYPSFGAGRDVRPASKVMQRSMYAQLERIDALGREHDLPALVLACGLPASADAWRDTRIAPGPPDGAEQARLFEELAWAVARASRDLRGFHGIAFSGFGDASEESRSDRALGSAAEPALARILSGGRGAR